MYLAKLYDVVTGELSKIVPVGSFPAGVFVVRAAVGHVPHAEVSVTWAGDIGTLEITRASTLATVSWELVDTTEPPIEILEACKALAGGNSAAIAALFA